MQFSTRYPKTIKKINQAYDVRQQRKSEWNGLVVGTGVRTLMEVQDQVVTERPSLIEGKNWTMSVIYHGFDLRYGQHVVSIFYIIHFKTSVLKRFGCPTVKRGHRHGDAWFGPEWTCSERFRLPAPVFRRRSGRFDCH